MSPHETIEGAVRVIAGVPRRSCRASGVFARQGSNALRMPALTVTCAGHPCRSVHARSRCPPSAHREHCWACSTVSRYTLRPGSSIPRCGRVLHRRCDRCPTASHPHTLTDTQSSELVGHVVAAGGTAEVIADGIRGTLEKVLPIDRRDDDLAVLDLRVSHASVPSGLGRR